MLNLNELLKYRELLIEFVKKDIKIKYKNSILGIVWSMLNPLLVMIVLTFIFSNIFKNSIPNFPVYCLSGKLLFDFFSQSTYMGMISITGKSSLIKKIYLPKYIHPLSKVIYAYVIFLISLIPLGAIMMFSGIKFSKLIVLSIYPLICLFVLGLGFGLIFATCNVFFRDIQHLHSVLMLILMYMSAIFYSVDIISPKYLFVLKLNPVYSVISVFRDCILYGQITSRMDWVLCGVYPIMAVLVGNIIFYKNEDKFIYYI